MLVTVLGKSSWDAVTFSDRALIELLDFIKEGKLDINAQHFTFKYTALHWAAFCGQVKEVRALIAQGANVDGVGDDRTPLHFAAQYGHEEVVKVLLKNKANVDAVDIVGLTPLHFAARNDKGEVVALLLAAGANPSLEDKLGLTPRARTENEEIKQLLEAAEVKHKQLKNDENGTQFDATGTPKISSHMTATTDESTSSPADHEEKELEVLEDFAATVIKSSAKGDHEEKELDDERHNLPPVYLSPSQEDHNASKTSFLSKHKWDIGLGVFVAFTPIVVGVVLPSTTGLPGPTIFVIALLSLVPACIVGGIVASIAGGVARMMSQPNAEQHDKGAGIIA